MGGFLLEYGMVDGHWTSQDLAKSGLINMERDIGYWL